MGNNKITKIKYFTEEKKNLINPENIKLYEKYRKSNIIKNPDVKDSTYMVYQNYMNQFLVYIAEVWENIELYSEDFIENGVDIMEGFMSFCQEVLKNNKKIINTKVSAVSSFYLWSLKRRLIDRHPFDKKLDRMKGANEEHIINSYFLNDEETEKISVEIRDTKKYDIIDQLIWAIMLDSANRIGAIDKLTLSSFDVDNCVFNDIREKRGYHVEVAFSEQTRDLILKWKELRKDMDGLTIDALFISSYGGEWRQMCKSTLQRRINKIGEIVGLEDFHSHCIRKTKLNDIYDKTGDLSLAAEYGNHKSTETTRSSYIKPKSKAQVREKIQELILKNKKETEVKEA